MGTRGWGTGLSAHLARAMPWGHSKVIITTAVIITIIKLKERETGKENKDKGGKAGEPAQGLRTLVLFPAPTQCLANTHNTRSRGPNTLFGSPQAPDKHVVHTDAGNICMYSF